MVHGTVCPSHQPFTWQWHLVTHSVNMAPFDVHSKHSIAFYYLLSPPEHAILFLAFVFVRRKREAREPHKRSQKARMMTGIR